jgi:hypothetical protein
MEQTDDRIERLERLVAEQAEALDAQRRTIEQLVAERRAPLAAPSAGTHRDPAIREGVSRRDVLRRALVAGGAVVAGSAALAVADAGPAAAANGDTVKAGQQTNAESSTVLFADAAASAYTYGIASVTDTAFDKFTNQPFTFGAVTGISTHGPAVGVAGYGSGTGVLAASDGGTAIYATGATALEATGATGIVASSYSSHALSATTTSANDASAIYAEAHGFGTAVEAHASADGSALQAYGTSAFFGNTVFYGRTYFLASGTVRVRGSKSRPARSATVTGIALTKTSKVIATIQGDGGSVGVAGVTLNVAKKTFTVTLTAKVARYVTIGWFIID